MLRASNQMNDFLESGRASRGGEGRESPQSSRKCLAKALSASSVSGGVLRQTSYSIITKILDQRLVPILIQKSNIKSISYLAL
mgnify:CR=1 FL=1